MQILTPLRPAGWSFVLSLVSLVLLAAPAPGEAARSSKPKEIVVVGSKIKEVVREAGLRSDGDLVQALSNRVRQIVADAARRGARNGRRTLAIHDIDCWSETPHRNLLVIPEALARLMARGGFRGDREFMFALSDKVHAILGDAIVRAAENKRRTVRPYDL